MPPIVIQTEDADGQRFTARSFLEYLRPSHPQWWGDSISDFSWVFRGHAQDGWRLIPHAWRSNEKGEINKLLPLIERIRPLSGSSTDLAMEHAIRSSAEFEAIYQFALFANSLGFDVKPIELSPLKAKLLHNYGPENIRKNIECFSIAQHHGVPTRLLDWTDDPLCAAHFATEHYRNKEAIKSISIWALNTTAVHDPVYSHLVRLHTPPRYTNPFLKAQKGAFTELINGDAIFRDAGSWPDFEQVLKDLDVELTLLRKLVLPASEVKELRLLLDREGVTKAHLMPTYDNVAERVVESWS